MKNIEHMKNFFRIYIVLRFKGNNSKKSEVVCHE